MNNIKIYEICDCDYVVTKLSKEDTREWYKKEYDTEEFSLDEMRECDLDNEKMLWESTSSELQNITFREAINKESEYRAFTVPFIIASTEY